MDRRALLLAAMLLGCTRTPPREEARTEAPAGPKTIEVEAPELPGARLRAMLWTIGKEPHELVLYLPGFESSPEDFGAALEPPIERAIASGKLPALAIVVPDPRTPLGGGFYAGAWKTAILDGLTSRATSASITRIEIVGHSMGGFGALAFARARPAMFHGAAALAPVLRPRHVTERLAAHIGASRTPAAVLLDPASATFSERLIVAMASALSPTDVFEPKSWRLSAAGRASLDESDLTQGAAIGKTVRLFVAAGSRDPLLPEEDVAAFEKNEPCATISRTDGDHTSRLAEDLLDALSSLTSSGDPRCR